MDTDSDPRNLIVNYIPTPMTDAELRKLFEQYGLVESARIIIDRKNNHPKGYGFVKFTTEDAARLATEQMNGFEIYNKRLRVTPARGPQNAQLKNAAPKVPHLHGGPCASPPSGAPTPRAPLPPPPPPLRLGPDALPPPAGSGYQPYQLVPALAAANAPMASHTAFAIIDGVAVQVVQAARQQIIAAAPPQGPAQPCFPQIVNGDVTANGPLLTTQLMESPRLPFLQQQQQQQQQQLTAYATIVHPLFS